MQLIRMSTRSVSLVARLLMCLFPLLSEVPCPAVMCFCYESSNYQQSLLRKCQKSLIYITRMYFDLRDAWKLDGLAIEKHKGTFSIYILHEKTGHKSSSPAIGLFFLNALHDIDHFKEGWKALFVKFLVTHHGSSLIFFFSEPDLPTLIET